MRRVVSEAEWQRMADRLDMVMAEMGVVQHGGNRAEGERLTPDGMDKDTVEKLKSELKAVKKERDHLAGNCDKYKEDLAHEAAFRKEMEVTWNSRGEQYRAESSQLEARVRTTEELLEKVSTAYRTLVEATRRDLRTLTTDREKIVRELRRLQDENDNLVGKHSALADAMASEVINLPDSQEEMQLLLLTYREDLIRAKIAKERAKNEISFMRSQLAGEQSAKEEIEDQLTQEVESLREKVGLLESCRSELSVEQERRRKAEELLRVSEKRGVDLKQQQSLVSKDAMKRVEEVPSCRDTAEAAVSELRSRIASLQQELDNSVAVQNDFVRLSQSLQVELEKIRQSEKEVRWQHEKDAEDCANCKSPFSVTKRKHHCRHCGGIFCTDCVGKQVPSGPNGRLSRVCDVCHTLLVQHSAPYFATEAPHME